VKAELAIHARDLVGEAPVWDAEAQRLLWVDHQRGIVHEARSDGANWRETRQWQLGRHIAAALPRAHGGLAIVGALHIDVLDTGGRMTPFARVDADPDRERLNDAKCDRRGRLWAGSLAVDFRRGAAALYRIDEDGSVHTVLQGLTLANGLDWGPDGSTFYLVDTAALSVYAFDFDSERGALANRRTLLSIERGAGGPNGLAVDSAGCLWVALTGGGVVRRYSPQGELLDRIELQTPGPTSCAFGGPDSAELFVTSRSGRMPDIAAELGIRPEMRDCTDADAGGLYVCRPGISGAAATPFAG
jgi:sugar lactone lactonase YvrE